MQGVSGQAGAGDSLGCMQMKKDFICKWSWGRVGAADFPGCLKMKNISFKKPSLPKVNNFGKLVTERIKGFLKDDDLTEFKDENL